MTANGANAVDLAFARGVSRVVMRMPNPKPHWNYNLWCPFGSDIRKRTCRDIVRMSEPGTPARNSAPTRSRRDDAFHGVPPCPGSCCVESEGSGGGIAVNRGSATQPCKTSAPRHAMRLLAQQFRQTFLTIRSILASSSLGLSSVGDAGISTSRGW